MQVMKLYRYIRPDGGVTVSTIKPETEYTELYRLVAEEGKALTDGEKIAYCADTNDPELWKEIDYIGPEEPLTEIEEKAKAFDILMGVEE